MIDSLFGAMSAFSAGLLSTLNFPATFAFEQAVLSLDARTISYYPGSQGFLNASARWNGAQTPQYDVIVRVDTEADVMETVGVVSSATTQNTKSL